MNAEAASSPSPPERPSGAAGEQPAMTWAEAVEWYRQQPGNEQAVLDNYFDRDHLAAAQRFAASEEFRATVALLPPAPADLLEIGAGTGMASYALAKAGFRVTALEPDASEEVGAKAIRDLAQSGGVEIAVAKLDAEKLPWPDASFDIVYARQVLHHVPDLAQLGREIARVLRPGGTFLATREHVLRTAEDLPAFLAAHPLHRHYGGENALLLSQYLEPMKAAGLEVKQVFGPLQTPINWHPMTPAQLRHTAFWSEVDARGFSGPPRGACGYLERPILALASRWLIRRFEQRYYEPGYLHSFLFRRP